MVDIQDKLRLQGIMPAQQVVKRMDEVKETDQEPDTIYHRTFPLYDPAQW